jgi:hypothetical protein
MDVTNHRWLSQRKQVAIVQQVFFRAFEALPPNVRFLHAVSADRRAHRSINDGDSTLEDILKRVMMVGSSHVSLISFERAYPSCVS